MSTGDPLSPDHALSLIHASRSGGESFRLPSTALFLGLIPVFSGQARRGDLTAALMDEGRPRRDRAGRVRSTQNRTYIVYNGRESQARTTVSLFEDDPQWQEGELSALIKRQFGPTGLKHLLGVFIAAEDLGAHAAPGGLPGGFVFDINRHLDILGYKRSNRVNGKAYHTTKHLSEARQIVGILCGLTIVQEIRLGTRRGQTIKVRLLLDEASATDWEDVVVDGERLRDRIETNERIYLRINPHLFSIAAEGTRAQQNFYTYQLKQLARENAHTHALTLTLGVHLPIKFRMSGCLPLKYSARAFLRMAGIAEDEYTAYEQLERLEKTIKYMVDKGYVSAFETERFRYSAGVPTEDGVPPKGRLIVKPKDPSHIGEPLDENWIVEAPHFLKELLANTLARRAEQGLPAAVPLDSPDAEPPSPAPRPDGSQPSLPGFELGGPPPHEGELLREVRNKLGLSQGQLAKKLNVTQAAISMAEAGKRPHMARRLFEEARRLRE
ncbi:MAG: helix-turn-helix domain-containing protein [Planctomycetes bacterium]|nr:helix-turn-helix domain-containing protein [Planctomycetota bacterium]